MASSLPRESVSFDDSGTGSCLFSPGFMKSCMDVLDVTEDIENGISLEDHDTFSLYETDDLMIGELGQDLSDLRVCDNLTLDETCSPDNMTFIDDNALEDSDKHAAEQGSEHLQSPASSLDVRNLLSTEPHAENSTEPTTPELVPALKGSRARFGMLPKPQLRVKWAPDVYDPTPTSDSHTVKGGHLRRPRVSKKDYGKQKHGKSSKSYKSSSYDRKSTSRKSTNSTMDAKIARFRALQEKTAVHGRSLSNIGSVKYPITAEEFNKCRSSFYLESLAVRCTFQ